MMTLPTTRGARAPLSALTLAVLASLSPAHAADAAGSADGASAAPAADAQTVEVTARHYDNAVGSSDAASQGVIRAELLKSRPALRPGEVLEFVPGLIVTQHSGDGKANQYFLRGFNLDHGTDFATTVDGMPVNMPTHGHGQGYSDLNFLIPELVDRIAYRKGPYFATHGDFASAGAADIAYKTRLDAPFAQLTLGQNGYRRGVLAGSTTLGAGTDAWAALEWMGNDGPWAVPEGLQRRNAVIKLARGDAANGSSLSLMTYDARWTSTDQVPQALIDRGSWQGQAFTRWSSLDPTDGGTTSRHSLAGEWHQQTADTLTRVSAYAMRYHLQLFSNFTYALERPDTGDQFSQKDTRWVVGGQASRAWSHTLAGIDATTELGLQLRRDSIRVGLFDTEARRILATTRDDQVGETLAGVYAQSNLALTPWLRGIVGLRADQARFAVDSHANAANSGRRGAGLWSPKLSLIAGPWARTELFFNAGRGFHSNDARGTTAQLDPKTGEAVDRVPGLVASRGMELGLRTEALPGLQSSVALWQLRFGSELVYVGDAGATEASGASRRHGIEFNNRWTPDRHFLLDADLAFTHARFDNGERIPNAVDKVASVAGTVQDIGHWSATLQWRYLGSGALIEDGSLRASPASTFNLRVAHDLRGWTGRTSSLSLDVFNLTNRRVNDIQYQYDYQLPGEPASSGRIVHPAEPRSLRLTWRTSL